MGYELSLDLYGGRLEIEADSMEELEEEVRALDLRRLERLIAEKRTGTDAPQPEPAQAAEAPAPKKATRKRAGKASAKKGAGKRATQK